MPRKLPASSLQAPIFFYMPTFAQPFVAVILEALCSVSSGETCQQKTYSVGYPLMAGRINMM